MPSSRDAILRALTAIGHQITADEIRLFRDTSKDTTALAQFCDSLEAVCVADASVAEAAYQRGKRSGHSEGYLAGREAGRAEYTPVAGFLWDSGRWAKVAQEFHNDPDVVTLYRRATGEAARTKHPSERGPIDANDLERMAKERPDECFLKGSGVLKLTGAIRQLEGQFRVALALLRDCVGPLEVSAAVIESDDGLQMEALIRRVQKFVADAAGAPEPEPRLVDVPAPYRCIRPQCPTNCSGCNHAIPSDDPKLMLIAELLDGLAVDGHGVPLEDGENDLVDRARKFLADAPGAASREEALRVAGAAGPLGDPEVLASPAADGRVHVQLGPEAFRFDSFQHWVNKAQSWFQTRMPDRARAGRRYIALDAAGRVCLIGSDFHRARDEGKFPVVVYLTDAEGS